MKNEASVEKSFVSAGWAPGFTEQLQPDLTQTEQIEVIDQNRAEQQQLVC
jgi:hypothetical protein